MRDEPDLSDAEIEVLRRGSVLLSSGHEHAAPDLYPRLRNLSAAFTYRAVVRAERPIAPEFVTVPMRGLRDGQAVAVAQWNVLWEAAQFRRRFFDEDDLPVRMRAVADRGDCNVVFLPRTRSRYHEYSPLYHLLPSREVERFGLPLLRGGQWPFVAEGVSPADYLPADFEHRLSKAWASAVWRHLVSGSPLSGFSDTEPIKLLAHNLDFWIPPVTAVIQDVLRSLPTVDNGIEEGPVPLVDGSFLEGAVAANPRMGGDVWTGEVEAAETVVSVVEEADADGRLRGILDAVRSHRVQDDFSEKWSNAREDFERKLYRKRAKIQVRFVELTDKIPVHGPESEIVDRMMVGDFMALLNERDREVAILLYSGVTKLTDVANTMGYSNHSPVSKRLNRIREQAARFFDER